MTMMTTDLWRELWAGQALLQTNAAITNEQRRGMQQAAHLLPIKRKPAMPSALHFDVRNPRPWRRETDVAATFARFGFVPPSTLKANVVPKEIA